MDYDTHDWVERAPNFERVQLTSDERSYSDLDLYLMGLLGPGNVNDFFLLSNIAPVSGGLFSAVKKTVTIQNIILAEGARVPDVSASQQSFKNAFVVLTGDSAGAQGLVATVDALRARFVSDFAAATRNLADVDTSFGTGPTPPPPPPPPPPRRRWW